jgi:HEPN domain-containing protein
MQPPISSSDEAREWLHRAHADLRIARLALDDRPPLTSEALYHCQQAVEKALKGFLVFHDQPIRKSHDLRELGEQIAPRHLAARDRRSRVSPHGIRVPISVSGSALRA